MEENTIQNTSASDLERCETVIERGLTTFWEVGEALAEVRDKQLWRGHYDTFAVYLAQRWKLKPAYAGNLILAAGIKAELEQHARLSERKERPYELPDTLAGACALKQLNTDQKIQVLETLHEKELPVTRENIKQEVETICPPIPKIPKLSYNVLRNSIGALVGQSEFFSSISPEKFSEMFATPDDRESAIETLTKIVELLSIEPEGTKL